MIDPGIARSARRLRLLVLAGIVAVVALYALGRFGPPQLGPMRIETPAAAPGWIGLRATEFALLLFVIAMARLAQMLGAIARGPLFGPQVTRAFRGFAFWLFLAILADVLVPLALASGQALRAGTGRVELAFELRDLLMLAGSLFLFLLARIMERARAIESELEEIV
jgi:hypothetical protein